MVGTVLDVLWSAEAATFRGSVERAEHAIFKRGRFDLLSGDPPPYPTTVRLLGEDGGVGHAVTIVGRWIFDATLSHALPLSRASLDDCCSSAQGRVAYRGVERAVRYRPVATPGVPSL